MAPSHREPAEFQGKLTAPRNSCAPDGLECNQTSRLAPYHRKPAEFQGQLTASRNSKAPNRVQSFVKASRESGLWCAGAPVLLLLCPGHFVSAEYARLSFRMLDATPLPASLLFKLRAEGWSRHPDELLISYTGYGALNDEVLCNVVIHSSVQPATGKGRAWLVCLQDAWQILLDAWRRRCTHQHRPAAEGGLDLHGALRQPPMVLRSGSSSLFFSLKTQQDHRSESLKVEQRACTPRLYLCSLSLSP